MTPLLEFSNVFYRYPGQQAFALNGLTLSLPNGEKIALIGRNGAGKSTFFLHCNGLYKPDSGQICFNGQPLAYDRSSLKTLRQHVGIVFQNADDQLFSASVAQDISFGPLNLGLSKSDASRQVQRAAELCDIIPLLDRPTHALSGGEKARVALAGVLAMNPTLLISDELMSSLDPWGRLRIFDIFKRLYNQGKTILLATHDLAVVQRWATYVVVMEAGRAVFSGPPDTLLTDKVLLEETGLSQVWRWDL